jgi:branched-chain amino acid transport system permease protein
MGVAWNILGGFTGYVNFGAGGFFAAGAYTSVFLHKAFDGPPILVAVVVASVVCGLIGLGVGYLTLRLKGVYLERPRYRHPPQRIHLHQNSHNR